MAKRMNDPAFRRAQWERRYDGQVGDLNRYVDQLTPSPEEGTPPYIAPHYRPDRATVLAVSRDPGPKADESGFLSYENFDESAARMETFLRAAGLNPDDVVPWNSYPWYIHQVGASRELTTEQIERGLPTLVHLVGCLTELRAVVAFGGSAQRSLRLLQQRHGDYLNERGIIFESTYHTGRQALRSNLPTASERAHEAERREEHIRQALHRVATHVQGSASGSPAVLARSRLVDVQGRPTGYGGGEYERRWKQAVREAFGTFGLPSPARISITLSFRLAPTQRGHAAPDLDNLIKATIDALEGVIGVRPIRGRPQADDERIDEIHATKRPCSATEQPGASLLVKVIDDAQ